jgi:tyrosyl-DNA phosphodiesterase-1
VPCQRQDWFKPANIISQVSSIATLTEKWLENLNNTLSVRKAQYFGPFFDFADKKPMLRIIFPTAEEIRQSLDGYASGASIHMKLQLSSHQRQLNFMKPMFCHWMSHNLMNEHVLEREERDRHDLGSGRVEKEMLPKREALRNEAAPHIKTYIRFRSAECESIHWAMVTSANLSEQAWGALPDRDGLIRVCSYELGVIVWPHLFREEESDNVLMVPTFGKDMPDLDKRGRKAKLEQQKTTTVVGIRMPYDLPLVPYKAEELPWSAALSYDAPDTFGHGWRGDEPH